MHELFGHYFLAELIKILRLNGLRMRFIYNVKHSYAIRLKFEEKFLGSLTKLVLEVKGSIYFRIKENVLLYCRKFLAFVGVVII